MSWFFFLDRLTGRLAAIIMSDGFGSPLSARFGVKLEHPSIDDYWELVDSDFIKQMLNENYELYEYDLDSENEESSSMTDLDPEDELAWEIPPVQAWVRGQILDRDHVALLSKPLGSGAKFTAQEIIAGDVHRRLHGEPEPQNARPAVEKVRCLWCRVPVERRYNFERNSPLTEYDLEDFEDPIVWSDGYVSERDSDEESDLFPNHYGDCVIACSQCGSMFLASSFEKENPRTNWYPDVEGWNTRYRVLVKGTCNEGANENSESTAVLTWAKLGQTMEFLKEAQSEALINWDEWIALQQVVNWLAHLDRKAKFEGSRFQFQSSDELLTAIGKFLRRVEQIKAGTLGSMSPFIQMHSKETDDENFFVHNYEVQEVLPVANMFRISGERSFGWATPRHPALREPNVMRTGWSELDQWIALRGKGILAATDRGVRDWAVAVDASGNLLEWGIEPGAKQKVR